MKVGDVVEVEVHYPYKVSLKLVDPKGKTVWYEIYDGGELKNSINVEVEGTYTFWVETLVRPSNKVLWVNVKVAQRLSSPYITEHTFEEERAFHSTRMLVAEKTQTTTLESHHTTYARSPLESRGIVTPFLSVLGLAILVLALVARRMMRKPARIIYCTNCGHPISPKDRYCEECGARQPHQ